jgi:hypothetical protein
LGIRFGAEEVANKLGKIKFLLKKLKDLNVEQSTVLVLLLMN